MNRQPPKPSDLAAATLGALSPERSKRETILATLDQVARAGAINEVTEAIVDGFIDIGAIMVVLMVRSGDHLEVRARRPESGVDELYRQLTGAELTSFTIPLSATDNPYVVVFRSLAPKLMRGPEEVADHILATYQGDPALRPLVVQSLHGRAGAVLPLVVGDEALGVAGINYADDLSEADLHLFNIFASSAARLLNFQRDMVSREAILADLERALDNERRTRVELNRAERLAALGEMSAVVAHEIRNPLAVIRNSLSSLERHLEGGAQSRLLCRIVDEESRRIERIINDMLAFSSRLEIRGQRVSAQQLIDQAIALAAQQAPGLDDWPILHQSASELLDVVVDPERLTHALVNVLVNASQATEQAGTVTIGAGAVSDNERSWVRITVADTGTGIEPDKLGQIWDPFFTTKATGVGLGLVIVKRVVDACDGRLTVDSKPGRGTTVTVSLPAATDDD